MYKAPDCLAQVAPPFEVTYTPMGFVPEILYIAAKALSESMAQIMEVRSPSVLVITPGLQVAPPFVERVKSEQAPAKLFASQALAHITLLSMAEMEEIARKGVGNPLDWDIHPFTLTSIL